MTHYDYHRPETVEEVLGLKRVLPAATFIAGGTDLMVRIKNRVLNPPALISLRAVTELGGIEDGEHTRIGALTTIDELCRHPLIAERYPLLAQAARRLGSRQIRNVATLGGNLCNCSPCADTATPLLVYDAQVQLQGPDGSRQVTLAEFFVGPGQTCSSPEEILSQIILPPPPADARTLFMKKGRVKMDLAIASTSVVLVLDGELCQEARLAVGSVAPVALRLPLAESVLAGQKLSSELSAEVARVATTEIAPIGDIRASADYRRQIIEVYLRRSIDQLAGIVQ